MKKTKHKKRIEIQVENIKKNNKTTNRNEKNRLSFFFFLLQDIHLCDHG